MTGTEKSQVMKYSLMIVTLVTLILAPLFYFRMNDPDFYVEPLSENLKQELITKNLWNESCPIPLERMRVVNAKHHLRNNEIKRDGKFIVLDVLADNTAKLFRELFKRNAVIEKINHITQYENHEKSKMDNNSLSFICDPKEKDAGLLYSYGVAFDINPIYNPELSYQNNDDIGKVSILVPKSSILFVNRKYPFEMKNDEFAGIFRKYGFSEWGGNWNYNINWHYFSINPFVASILLAMTVEDGKKFIDIVVKNIKFVERFNKSEFNTQLKYLYQKDPSKFLKILEKKFSNLKDLTDSQFFDLLRKNINSG